MLLALETSTRVGSIALVDVHGEGTEVVLDGGDVSVALAPAVRDLVPDFGAVTAYTISIGPGSFTGLRIGIAFLKGLAMVHPRPVVPVSTLELVAAALAEAHPARALFLPLFDARKREVYAGLYRRSDRGVVLDPRLPDGLYRMEAVAELLRADLREEIAAAGDGSTLDFGPIPRFFVDPERGRPSARVLGRIAAARHLAGEGEDARNLEPAYHQRSGAERALGFRSDDGRSDEGPTPSR